MTRRKQKPKWSAEQKRLKEKLFETVYKWGRVKVKATPNSEYYEELIWELIKTEPKYKK